jgi:hypothetical protein
MVAGFVEETAVRAVPASLLSLVIPSAYEEMGRSSGRPWPPMRIVNWRHCPDLDRGKTRPHDSQEARQLLIR